MPILPSLGRSNRRRKKGSEIRTRNMSSLFNNVEDSMKSLYSDTYLSDRSNLDAIGYVADKMEDNIDAIIRRNNQYDISNTSKLYSRLMRKESSMTTKSDKQLSNELESLFGDSNFTDAILGSYLSNKWIADYDKEVDTVLKMLPSLAEALEVLKDAVLSADSISKDYIYSKVSVSDDTELRVIMDRINKITTKYSLTTEIEDWYDSASRYGEAFVYRVPYNKAIERLLARRQKDGTNHNVSVPMVENGVINESVIGTNVKDIKLPSNCSFNVEIDTSRMLSTCVEDSLTAHTVQKNAPASLMESYMNDVVNGDIVHEKTKIDKVIPDDLVIPDGLNTDGYRSKNGSNKNNDVDVRGCVIKTLDRKNLIRLYVDNICLGYYYLEFRDKNDEELNYYMDGERNLGYTKGINTLEKTIADNLENNKVDHLMRLVAKQMSDKLDATFVNANQDLTKEIYAILKYNDIFNSNTAVRVSFLPPEDVKWLRFREDKDLHIGISDIHESLYPAKLLAMLYVTYVTGTLTRGQDKRVYYVKQTVETNIAQTLLNVINQIKKSNFNSRSIENLNNLLNITGRFNDYIIPVGPSGDSPIQFEVMPGQEFNINQELMDLLEQMAINPIAPIELVQARLSPDYATQYTTSSLRLLRKTYRRQARMELFISELYTDIYAAEYGEYQQIDCELPPPVFLNMVNTNQLFENTKQFADGVAEMEYADETSDTVDQEKAIFVRKLIKSRLSTYIRPDEIEKYKKSAKFEIAKKATTQDE